MQDEAKKLRQKDTDAKWTKKSNIAYFDYKNHVKADTKTKLITGYLTTSAEVHDSAVIEELVDQKEDADQPLYADRAYRSEEIEQLLAGKGIESDDEKAYRNQPLRTKVRVKHIFAFMENSMNGMYIKCRSGV